MTIRRRPWVWVIVAICVAHRLLLAAVYGDDYSAQLEANPTWVTVQLQAVDALRDQPLEALWSLQATPPIPNVIVAALLRFVSWPSGMGWALAILQVLTTLGVALGLTALGRRLLPHWVAVGLGVLWVLHPDIILLETTSMGQMFYENLAALLLLAAAWSWLRWMETADAKSPLPWALGFGASLGLVALVRSSYGFLSLVLLPATCAWLHLTRRDAARARALRHLAWAAVLALGLQGAWAAKNLVAFGHWTWPASTWGGASLAGSLARTGTGQELAQWILETPQEHAPWFVEFVAAEGTNPWTSQWRGPEPCPAVVLANDERTVERLRGQDRRDNTQCQRLVSEEYGHAAIGYLVRHPGTLVEKWKFGYAYSWFPMRYHAGQYLALFTTEWVVERPLRPWRSLGQWLAGELPETVSLNAGERNATVRRPARVYSASWPATAWWLVEIVTLHLLTPIVLLAILWRCRRAPPTVEDGLLLLLATIFLYSAAVHHIVEFGENMRFRWSVEALIWLLVADTLRRTIAWAAERRRLRARRGAPTAGRR